MGIFFKKVWYILGDSRNKLPLLLITLVFSSIAETLGIGILGPFIIIATDPSSIHKVPILEKVYQSLNLTSEKTFIIILCFVIILGFCLKSILYFFSKFYIIRFSHMHRGEVIQRLNRAYINCDYSYFINKNSASHINNIISETQLFHFNVLLALLYGISNILILILLFTLLAITNLSLLLTTMAALLPVFIAVYALKNRLKTWGRVSSESQQKIIQILNHGLGGLKETRIVGCEAYFENQMETYTKKYVTATSLANSFEMLPRVLIETTLIIFVISFIALNQFLTSQSSELLISSLSIFALSSIRLLPAASQVMFMLGLLQSSRHTVDLLYLDLTEAEQQYRSFSSNTKSNNIKTDPINKKTSDLFVPQSTISFIDKVCLKDISYCYSDVKTPAINKISLEICKGESIALIGKSGAGKTTLVDLILGLLTPQDGDITVDSVSIYQNLRIWQNLLGYIPQSIFLLDDTIERNIAFGVPDEYIDRQKLEEVIIAAQLEEFVNQLPRGLQTQVGERGVMLSGGQRQRIGIARALYHEREILVLDEATSALDHETEQRVSEAISALAGKKTLIIIAHRLTTVRNCDRVYLLEKGKVVKFGSYAEVIKIS